MISTMLLVMSMSGAAAPLHAGQSADQGAAQNPGHNAPNSGAPSGAPGANPIAKSSPQPDDGVEVAVRRIYDLRDLAAMLPTNESLDEVTRTVWDELVSAY